MLPPQEKIPGYPNFRSGPPKSDAPLTPLVVFQPKVYKAILQGVNFITDAVRPTLGPLPRLVLNQRTDNKKELPEFLDDGAIIARRIIEIRPRTRDIGAKLIRHAMWKMHEEIGDGSVTMAIIYRNVLQEGIRYVTQFGCNAMLLRAGLEKGLKTVVEAVQRQSMPLLGRQAIANIAQGMCQGDGDLAQILGEVFDMVGPDGLIVIEGYEKWSIEREYIEGTYWKLSGYFSRHFITHMAEKKAVYEDAAILITDMDIKGPELLVPVLEKCVKAGIKKLVIVASSITDSAIGLLVNNNQARTIESMAIRIPKVMEMDRVAAMEDIAVLTGGKIYHNAAYSSLDEVDVTELGHARRIWATESMFGIYGGKGDPRKIRKHIADVRGLLKNAELESQILDIRSRIGRLNGGTVIIRLGGIHETERETRKTVAERAVSSLKHAITGGVVPGGGSALIEAQAALAELSTNTMEDEIAIRILKRAIEEPLRCIAQNAGYVPDVIVEKVKSAPAGYGMDARTGKIVDMRQTGIQDPTIVLVKALEIGVSGAAIALTTDVVIHHSEPEINLEP